jgi:hypothetical protein
MAVPHTPRTEGDDMADPVSQADTGQAAAAANGAPAEEELYPYPEILADWQWVYDEYGTGRFEPYLGNFIAVHERQVLGSGPREPELRKAVAAEHHLDPDRLVTMYIGDRE